MQSDLNEHAFVREVMQLTRPAFEATLEHVRGRADREAAQAEARSRMSPADRYGVRVLQRTLGLLAILQYLGDARRLLRVFPTQLGRSRAAITRDRWADYHFGFFTVSLASIPDIAVVLTAAVCQLGLHPRHCKMDVVVSHDAVRGTSIATALKTLGSSVHLAKERRNRHVHHGDRAEIDALIPDGFILDIKTVTFLQSMDPTFIDPRFLRYGWRQALKEILPRLDEEVARVQEALSVLLDELLPELRARSVIIQKAAGQVARAT